MGNTLQTLHPPTLPHPQPQPQPQPQEQQQQQQQQELNENQNQEFTCEICIEPTKNKFQNHNNQNCSHPFCTDCVVKYIRATLEQNNVGPIKCPAYRCPHALDAVACAPLVGPELFVRWCDLLCESAILELEKCYCPYRNCGALIVNECADVEVGRFKCPNCKRFVCFGCKRVWHAGFGCEESGVLRDPNDVAFGRLVEMKKWMRCPRCRHFVELSEGCQIVKCRCGISFCYKCGKQVYKHWCSCNKTSTCCVWCFRFCVLFIFMTFVFFFMTWATYRHRRST